MCFRIIGPQQQYMEEIEQQMWDEGDAFRQRDGDSVATSLGSLALTKSEQLSQAHQQEPKRTRLTANESKVAEEGDLGQGERLREARAQKGGKIKDDTAWRREDEDSRLSRK